MSVTRVVMVSVVAISPSQVNETDGDPSGEHVLTLVRTTGKAITVRWEPWEGETEAYAVLCDGGAVLQTLYHLGDLH